MIKKILSLFFAAFLAFSLISCSATVENENTNPMFVKVKSDKYWYVVYHLQSKVMYVVSDVGGNIGAFTLLVNPDGSPMLWEG